MTMYFLSHSDDFSRIREGDRRRRQSPTYDSPRFIHTNTDSFARHVSPGEDIQRMNRGPYNRRQNQYSDFESHRSVSYDGSTNYNTQTRDYTSRMSSARDRRVHNYRDYDHATDNYDNAYHKYDNSYHDYNNYASYDYHDYRPVRRREGSHRQEHVMTNKPYSSRDRHKPYSRQRRR